MHPQCKALVALLGTGNVLLPRSTGYNESITSYFSPQASAVRPLCFVTLQTADEVSAVVKSLISGAHGDSTSFAVRGGGHMWIPGAPNSDGGVTVDLRGLDSVELGDDHSTASGGGGTT
jgi:FAD/FMN-containing dehydrogenase